MSRKIICISVFFSLTPYPNGAYPTQIIKATCGSNSQAAFMMRRENEKRFTLFRRKPLIFLLTKRNNADKGIFPIHQQVKDLLRFFGLMVVFQFLCVSCQQFLKILQIMFANFLDEDLRAFCQTTLDRSLIEIEMRLQTEIRTPPVIPAQIQGPGSPNTTTRPAVIYSHRKPLIFARTPINPRLSFSGLVISPPMSTSAPERRMQAREVCIPLHNDSAVRTAISQAFPNRTIDQHAIVVVAF